MKKKIIVLLTLLTGIPIVKAHCPLCTIGAVAVAGGAAYYGVNNIVIGIFIGAFAVSIGWWVSNLIKKKYIPYQKPALILFSFLATVIPILPLFSEIYPIYISLIGGYGSILNRTYIINMFLVGSIIGGFIVSITPWLSKKISSLRNGKMIPYQGIILTFGLLIIAGLIIQFVL